MDRLGPQELTGGHKLFLTATGLGEAHPKSRTCSGKVQRYSSQTFPISYGVKKPSARCKGGERAGASLRDSRHREAGPSTD